MASHRDYYTVLGVQRSAGEDEIKAAYRRLARQCHPDVNKAPDAAEKFNEVQQAYETLSDPKKRSLYDRVGHEAFGPGARAGSSRGPTYTWSNVAGGGFGGANEDFDLGDISDLFSEMFGGRSPFGQSAKRGARARSKPARGEDAHAERTISFETSITGGTETVRVQRGGAPQTIDIKVPRGVADGAKLRVRGAGEPSRSGGSPGDLILTIRVAQHPLFRRTGLDVELDLPVSITEATLGANITVPTPAGEQVQLKVPPATPGGTKLRIRDRGVTAEDGVVGDLYAIVRVIPPKSLSEQDRATLRDLGDRLPPTRTGPLWT